jgi:hypothetical protein
MKQKNRIIVMLILLFGLSSLISCTKVDSTTYTTFNAFTQPEATSPVVRADGTVLFTGSSLNLAWTSVNQNSGPESWTVYFGTGKNPALYQKGLTTKTLAVPVLDGQTYYWKVEIVDSRNDRTTSDVFKFTSVSGTNPKMGVLLTCTTDVKSAIGTDLTPDQVVNLRLLVMKKSDMSVVTTVNTGIASEVYNGFATLPDGEYVLGVDIASTVNAGDLNKPITLSLSLLFEQLGMINKKLDFANVMTNVNPCSLYRTYLATVKKEGPVYTIAQAVSYLTPPVLTWKGTDADSPSQVKTTESCTAKTMTGLGFGWMLDWWGEVIVSGGTLTYTVSGTNITIPLQKYCKTTYNGAAQPEYSIQGTGTIDNSGAYPVWTIKYDFIQSGQSIGSIANQYGWPTTYFEAVITTNPAGI